MDDASEALDIVGAGEVLTPALVLNISNWGGDPSDGRDDNLIDGSGLSGVGDVTLRAHDDFSTISTTGATSEEWSCTSFVYHRTTAGFATCDGALDGEGAAG